jgi:hypothetical protein
VHVAWTGSGVDDCDDKRRGDKDMRREYDEDMK